MSQAQINSTQVLCRLLELDKPQISGQALHEYSKDGAQHLIRERMLVHGPSSQWINCPECGVELARIVRDVSVDDVLLQCPECDDVTAPKHYSHNHKVSFTKLVSNLSTSACTPIPSRVSQVRRSELCQTSWSTPQRLRKCRSTNWPLSLTPNWLRQLPT